MINIDSTLKYTLRVSRVIYSVDFTFITLMLISVRIWKIKI